MNKIFVNFCLALLSAALASGCSKSDEDKATQVAAKVNSDEITVHQINYVLARQKNVPPDSADKIKREILNKLINEELAKQQAVKQKLDRLPGVLQAIEASKTEILARAYFEQIAAAQPKPTDVDIKKYYQDHPELFAQRRIFNLEEILVLPEADLTAGLRDEVAKAHSMQDIATWLKSQDAKFAETRGTRAAEDIPLDLLPKLQTMKDGEFQLIETKGPLQVFHLVSSTTAPVDETKASPRIERFLFNQRSAEAIAKEMKQIKENAHIVYVGEFAKETTASEGKPAVKSETVSPAQLPAQNFEEGIRGLK